MNLTTIRPGLLSRWAALALTALAAIAAPVHAQGTFPDKPVKFVVPYPPGGGTDVIARIVQERFQHALGQPVVIDNRGGAAGSLGTDIVAKAPADGYTVLFTLSSHTINPSFYSKLPFDTAKDFEPVGTVAIAAADPGRESCSSRQHRGRADRGGEGEAEHDLVRIGRQRLARPPRRRAAQAAHRHADDAHPVPRRRPRGHRRDGRPGAVALGLDPGGGGLRQAGQAEGARGLDGQAQRRVPRRADDAGGRRARFRGRLLVRDVRAGEDAEAGDRAPQQGAERRSSPSPRSRTSCSRRAAKASAVHRTPLGQIVNLELVKWGKLAKEANLKAE